MFKGLKKAVKGGISTVSEQGSSLAGKVAGDSLDLKDKLAHEAKSKIQGGVEYVSEGSKKVQETPASEYKDKTKEVAHRVKHYGALGEDYLGYSDPGKDLRKAVKAKEKAAKKAKKAKKKKGIKEDDLFSPENLAKFKAELEERRRLAEAAQEISPQETGEQENGEKESEEEDKGTGNREGLQLELTGSAELAVTEAEPKDLLAWSADASPEFGPPVVEEPSPSAQSGGKSGGVSPAKTPRDGDEGWKRFTELTSGIDHLLKEKSSKLEEIKASSYYQRKKTQVEILEDSKVERSENLVDKRKKHWIDLDAEGFDEKEGVVEDVSDASGDEENQEKQTVEVTQETTDSPDKPEGEVDVESDKESSEEEEEDFFNTAFVDVIVSGDIKLNVIPDSPTENEDDDDPFNTNFAETIVEKHEKDKKYREKVESNKVKFGCIAAAADVLEGRAAKLGKHEVDHAVKKRSRRANRINLIADDVDNVTALDDIHGVDVDQVEENNKKVEDQLVDIFGAVDTELDVPVAELLSSSSVSPVPNQQTDTSTDQPPSKNQKLSEDLKEFDFVACDEGALTSNVAILAAEFSVVQDEEDDPFDEAFDLLAKDSINKFALQDIEKDLNDDDLFDTTKADTVLNLASIANLEKEKEEEEILDTFDDKDPFDTSAVEHLTRTHEEDLEFDFLAKRDPHETVSSAEVAADTGKDPFEVVDRQLSSQNSTEGSSWADFGGGKKKPPARPSKPPPPRPPRPPPTPRVEIDYASGRNTPSVIIKAPSTESIKSWNNAQADTLIRKSKIEDIEASLLEQEKEFDPFDTTEYTKVVDDIKAQEDGLFDSSAIEKEKLKQIESELIDNSDNKAEGEGKSNEAILKDLEDTTDPFDTGFVSDIVKEETTEDPFDTNHAKEAAVDPEEDPDFDPFDTTVAEKVIPVRKPKISQRATISIEDDEFDPEAAFKKKGKRAPPPRPDQSIDPFSVAEDLEEVESIPVQEVIKPVTGPYARPRPQINTEEKKKQDLKELEEELIGGGLKHSITDDDFDPRAEEPEKTFNEPVSDLEEDEEDPFDTSGF